MNKYESMSDAELDRLVAEKVMGWVPENTGRWWLRSYEDDGHTHHYFDEELPDFTQSHDAFFKWVVPRMLELGFSFEVSLNRVGGCWARFISAPGKQGVGHSYGKAFPRAGVIVALLAVEKMEVKPKDQCGRCGRGREADHHGCLFPETL